jgi:hypothetical protein
MDKKTIKSKYVPVSLTEQFILNYAALPPEFDSWRYYRVEYGGCNEDCFKEMPIFLPPAADPEIIELLFELWQARTHNRRKKIKHKIIEELEIYL